MKVLLLFNSIIEDCRYWRAKYIFKKRYFKVCSLNCIPNRVALGEKDWLKKWRRIDPYISALQYRVFSHFIGTNQNIVPEETSHFKVEPYLNSRQMAPFYSDKNMFDKLLPTRYLPKTILRRIDGYFYDANYQSINLTDALLRVLLIEAKCDKAVLKPSVGGESGKGIQLFSLNNQGGGKNVLTKASITVSYLTKECGSDFILQEAIHQDEYISQFNRSSVNTLRLAIYRSVKDNQCHVVGAILRIGATGSVVDNAHAGGCFVGIKPNGTFCNYVSNQYGQTCSSFNDIDFSKEYKYPNWDCVTDFGMEVAQHLIHHRLVALDIALKTNGKPVLIEYNITPGTFSMWLFQYTVGAAYSEFADEIIEYCKERMKHE